MLKLIASIALLLFVTACLSHGAKNKSNQEIKIPALGRQFRLGCLYDQRIDDLIGECSFILWNEEHLENNTKKITHPHENAQVLSTQSMDEKAHAFHMGADVSANILSGIIKIHGSARYMDVKTASNYEVAVAFKYNMLTHTEAIGQDIIFDVDFNERIKQFPTATHVVNSITYGGSTIFSFKKSFKKMSNKKTFKGSLLGSLGGAFAKVSGNIDVDITEMEKKKFAAFQCEFFGDVNLKKSPVTFEAALETFKSIPGLINETNSIPMKVGLLPIHLFNNERSRLVHSIKEKVLEQFHARAEEYENLLRTLGDIQHQSIDEKLKIVGNHVEMFKEAVKAHLTSFKKRMAQLLISARRGNEHELDFNQILTETGKYTIDSLFHWVLKKKEELSVLKRVIDWRPSCITTTEALLHGRNSHVIILVLKIYPEKDPFTLCLLNKTKEGCEKLKYKGWYSRETGAKIRNTVNMFTNAIEGITGTKEILNSQPLGYGIVEKENNNKYPSASIKYHKSVELKDPDLQFPQIENIKLDFNCTNYFITWESNVVINLIITEQVYTIRYKAENSTDWTHLQVTENKADIEVSTMFKETNHHDRILEVQLLINCIFGYCGWYNRKFDLDDIWFKLLNESCKKRCGLSDSCAEHEDCEDIHMTDSNEMSTCTGSDGCRYLSDSYLKMPEKPLAKFEGILAKHQCCNECIKNSKCVGFVYYPKFGLENKTPFYNQSLEQVCSIYHTVQQTEVMWSRGVIGGFIENRILDIVNKS